MSRACWTWLGRPPTSPLLTGAMPTGPDAPTAATTTLGTTAAANAKSLEKSLEASLESSESFDEIEKDFAHWVDVDRAGSMSFQHPGTKVRHTSPSTRARACDLGAISARSRRDLGATSARSRPGLLRALRPPVRRLSRRLLCVRRPLCERAGPREVAREAGDTWTLLLLSGRGSRSR